MEVSLSRPQHHHRFFYSTLTLTSESESNGLLVIRQIDNTSPGGAPGGKLVIRTHSHQTFQQKRSENQGGHSSL